MKFRQVGMFIAGSLALFAGFVGSVAAHPAGRAAALGSASFTDPAGDAEAGAPDLTAVTINGDPANGTITVTVTAPGYTPVAQDALERDVDVWLDTDKNTSTGSTSGSEYVLNGWNDSTGSWWDMGHWDGSSWQSVPQSATMSATRSGDVLSWTINTADIGGATGFSFYVSARTYDGDNPVGRDFAPNDGKWTYDISAASAPTTTTTGSAPTRTLTMSLTPVIGRPVAVPVHPAAGKRLTFSFRVTRSDDHKPLTKGKMAVALSVAGRPVAHTQSFANGVARLSLLVPRDAKGKRLTVKLTIKAPSYQGEDGAYVDVATGQTGTIHTFYEGQTATKTVNLPVR